MLLDQLKATITVPDGALVEPFANLHGRVYLTDTSGEVECEFPRRRPSDAPGVQLSYGADGKATIEASPARVLGDAVFGSGAAFALDVAACTGALVELASELYSAHLGANLASELPPAQWTATKVDVTRNYYAGTRALAETHFAQLARYLYRGKFPDKHGHGLYWSKQSAIFGPKVYLKGQALRRQFKQGVVSVTPAQLTHADTLLRFELQVRSDMMARFGGLPTPADLSAMHEEVFHPMVDETNDELCYDDAAAMIRAAAPTDRIATTALRFYELLRYQGFARTRRRMDRRTFSSQLLRLRRYGLTGLQALEGVTADRDVDALSTTPRLVPVDSWDELRSQYEATRASP